MRGSEVLHASALLLFGLGFHFHGRSLTFTLVQSIYQVSDRIVSRLLPDSLLSAKQADDIPSVVVWLHVSLPLLLVLAVSVLLVRVVYWMSPVGGTRSSRLFPDGSFVDWRLYFQGALSRNKPQQQAEKSRMLAAEQRARLPGSVHGSFHPDVSVFGSGDFVASLPRLGFLERFTQPRWGGAMGLGAHLGFLPWLVQYYCVHLFWGPVLQSERFVHPTADLRDEVALDV